ncbi:MAG: pantoate--beta-alanine ligase [Saprospiraceae bacterium]|jgi:pantoate--beta-alanine ligase|nr:pantoate--beta-alanine ligase [Saprospiraceae bacterium]MBK9993037.1 pantoate--beta-alanine ligase [Saprospiraceae bacterium]
MQTINTVLELQQTILNLKKQGKKISFIPTMGALHKGHTSLIKIGKKHADITIASIFINPTQFNNPDDLKKYPRMLDNDKLLLEKKSCDILFTPSIEEIYPKNLETKVNIDLNELEKPMEGEFRPGHFEGMMQVVKRLLDIVMPDYLIMGQKDFQQFTIVAYMIKVLKIPVELIVAPTLREKDGLAMSSRNMRLSPKMRAISPIIYQELVKAKEDLKTKKIGKICENGLKSFSKHGLKPEYFRICDGFTLKPIEDINNHSYIVACVAAWAEDVRLIDNMILKKAKK